MEFQSKLMSHVSLVLSKKLNEPASLLPPRLIVTTTGPGLCSLEVSSNRDMEAQGAVCSLIR